MARKHKHEEHVNHERWLVSYADMVTLLFALFVVLYAMGVTELERVKELKKSIQFAFHIDGDGKTKEPGVFDEQQGAGDVPVPAPLVSAQDGGMKEFLKDVLRDFEEVAGRSLQIDQTNDTIQLRAPLDSFFEPGRASPIRKEVQPWLGTAVLGALAYTSDLLISIDARDVPIGVRDERRVTSMQLCMKRLETLRRFATYNPEVRPHMVRIEYREPPEFPARPTAEGRGDWERGGEVIFAFSNRRPK